MNTPLTVFVFVVAGAAAGILLAFVAGLVSELQRVADELATANALEKDRQLRELEQPSNVRQIGGPKGGPRRPPAGKR